MELLLTSRVKDTDKHHCTKILRAAARPQHTLASLKTQIKVKQVKPNILTLLIGHRFLHLALSFGLAIIRQLGGHAAGHVELIDVQGGFAEG